LGLTLLAFAPQRDLRPSRLRRSRLSDAKAGSDKSFAQDETLTKPSKMLRTFVR
jgi:hypothetical protein